MKNALAIAAVFYININESFSLECKLFNDIMIYDILNTTI